MLKKILLLLLLPLFGITGLILPKAANAFGCTSNGVAVGGTGTYTIPINVTLSKTTNSIILTDMAAYTTCTGDYGTGYQDALRTSGVGASISSVLTGLGYTGFAMVAGTQYNFPLNSVCAWPDAGCTIAPQAYTGQATYPVNVKIGMQRQSSGTGTGTGTGTTIPVGAEIARFIVNQRSQGSWGWTKTWIFTTKNAIVIPAYTCTWTNPNQTVPLLPVKGNDLRTNGAGRYPVANAFAINLTCDPQTTVTMKMDGTTMSGTSDVLKNTSPDNEAIGVQLTFKDNPVVYGQNIQVIANSQAQEVVPFNAYYYYNGGTVRPGQISAVATVTLTYN